MKTEDKIIKQELENLFHDLRGALRTQMIIAEELSKQLDLLSVSDKKKSDEKIFSDMSLQMLQAKKFWDEIRNLVK